MNVYVERHVGDTGRPDLNGTGPGARRRDVVDRTPSDGQATDVIRSIGVLGYDKVSEQDCLTPVEIFKGATLVLRGDIAPWPREAAPEELTVELVSLEPGVVTMQMGTQVVPDRTLDPDHLYDLLYIPGGVGSGAIATDERVLELIRGHHAAGRVVAANCSGVGVVARAGILDDATVTSVAAIGRGLREEGFDAPATRRMWVGDPGRRVWTATGSYGVNASAVAIVAYYFGREVGTIVSMMFDTLAGIGEAVFDPIGPQFFEHEALESSFQDLFQPMLLPPE
ncbi:DJ-1/PfpI family protein [Angustibacter sp. McL0619]|uniref:DJ-1/PfpI family protein n=1 Tax=Angustibacter sp. McL0619 TaxID=3415676 RepID=UPI003CEE8071